jgi:YEATS domain-containing protein 4
VLYSFLVVSRSLSTIVASLHVWHENESFLQVNHLLKLYPPGTAPNVLPTTDTNEPVVSEKYDEVVFTDPNETFYRQLNRISVVPKIESSQQEHLAESYPDQDDFLALIEAQKFLKEELAKVKGRFLVVSDELQTVDQALRTAQQQQQREAASKKTKAPASQRKPRPPSQNKKAKT